MFECVQVANELDRIFRTMLRDCPAKLAEWKAVTREYDRQCEEYFKYLDDHESE